MKSFYFFLCLFFVLLSSHVVAIGVSPGRYDLNFQPGFEHDFEFYALNNQEVDVLIGANLHRDLTEFSTITPDKVLVPAGGKGKFVVHMELPATIEEFEHQGRNILEIYFVEESQSGSGISARTGVVPWVVVDVPYPERYAEITSFGVSSVNQGNDASGSFTLKNRGNEDLDSIRVKITLFDNQNNSLETIQFNNIAVTVSQEFSESFTFSTASLPAQDYYAVLNMSYDDEVKSKEVKFRLGDLDGAVVKYPVNITKQGIVPFDITVENYWNGKVFMSGSLQVPLVGVIDTPRLIVLPFKTNVLKSYVDTTKLSAGVQNISATILIEDAETGEEKSFSEELSVLVLEPEKEKKSFDVSMTTIVLVALIVLLVVSMTIIIMMVVKKK